MPSTLTTDYIVNFAATYSVLWPQVLNSSILSGSCSCFDGPELAFVDTVSTWPLDNIQFGQQGRLAMRNMNHVWYTVYWWNLRITEYANKMTSHSHIAHCLNGVLSVSNSIYGGSNVNFHAFRVASPPVKCLLSESSQCVFVYCLWPNI